MKLRFWPSLAVGRAAIKVYPANGRPGVEFFPRRFLHTLGRLAVVHYLALKKPPAATSVKEKVNAGLSDACTELVADVCIRASKA